MLKTKKAIKYFSSKLEKSLIVKKTKNSYTLELNEPKTKNALSQDLLSQLENSIKTIKNDPKTKSLFIKSSTPKTFCTGANLKERLKMTPCEIKKFVTRLRNCFHSISKLKVPTFALIDGHCLGGGLELALSCDFRLITKNSFLGLPETNLAILPGLCKKSWRDSEIAENYRIEQG